ncbi:innexin inx2-like protein [Dinothrombium tinctorium]|uniref:Innexin n=1 Tax=Dinothrombium tinctorium TaxID=1965070 RepID=A0A3S3NV37_9ACAR|nr:innexin inx2-like protein [Dinothrombium tinctorium]
MDQLFGSLKSFIKPQACIIDNQVFRLHYKFSVVILIAFSVMVTARQYFGDPIDCISKDDIPSNLLDTYCWIHTTFSLEDAWRKKVGTEVPYPGVDKYKPGEKRVYHAYYQWVCFVLFFQALFFYVPRYFWKSFEGGRMKNLLLGLNSPIVDEDQKKKNIPLLVSYLERNLHNHNTSFYVYCFAEILNLVNVVVQMVLMNRFLHGEFMTYGLKVISFSEWDWALRYDPMIQVFPRLTKCTFHRFGSSGDVQKHDAMCILPINIINEKVYIFLWFWFCFLFFVTLLGLVYRAMIILLPKMRVLATQSRCRLINKDHLEVVINKIKIGDWFVLDLLGKNLNALNFKELVEVYYMTLQDSKSV